jgi:hypothetical protein
LNLRISNPPKPEEEISIGVISDEIKKHADTSFVFGVDPGAGTDKMALSIVRTKERPSSDEFAIKPFNFPVGVPYTAEDFNESYSTAMKESERTGTLEPIKKFVSKHDFSTIKKKE